MRAALVELSTDKRRNDMTVPYSQPLQVCFFTADVPFSEGHGGTATAFLLLAALLAQRGHSQFNVTLVGLDSGNNLMESNHLGCRRSTRRALAAMGVYYDCLLASDLQPDGLQIVANQYWEAHTLAVVSWLDRHVGQCDIVHGHEWGGVFAYLAILLQLDPQRFPGLHLMLGTHGGHMWSQLGLNMRPNDLDALRVDHMEKLSVEWSDTVLSPSRYMLGYFATRGWRVEHRLVIPNVIHVGKDVSVSDSSTNSSDRKPVWQLLFAGRLEERKGIRVLLNVIARLSASQYWKRLSNIGQPPAVFMYGSSAAIDGENSESWLTTRIREAKWAVPVVVQCGMNRSMILERLQEPGVLLVVPSLQENLPYALAEAAMLRVPTVTFDVGGSREVLLLHEDDRLTFCSTVSSDAMYEHILQILTEGSHYTPRLAPNIGAAGDSWMDWHLAYRKVRLRLIAEQTLQGSDPMITAIDETQSSDQNLQILHLPRDDSVSTAFVIRHACPAGSGLPGVVDEDSEENRTEELVLLLPGQFQLIPSRAREASRSFMRYFADLSGSKRHLRRVAALTFGVRMDNTSVSFPSAPTWLLYSRHPGYCEPLFPILVRRRVLCQAFAVDTHVFPIFEPWILSDVLSQQNLQLVTHPDVLFQYHAGLSVTRLSSHPQCQPWAIPIGRYREARMLDHFHRDVFEDMRDLYFPRKVSQRQYTDLTSAIRTPTLHHSARGGWSFSNGSIGQWKLGAINEDSRIHWFTWYPQQHRFGCNEHGISEPYVDHMLSQCCTSMPQSW